MRFYANGLLRIMNRNSRIDICMPHLLRAAYLTPHLADSSKFGPASPR